MSERPGLITMTSTVSTRDPIEEFALRWSTDKITRLTFEHSWTIGKFPVLDQFSSKKSEEEMPSPEFEIKGHDLKFQMKLRYAGMEVEDDTMKVHFSLCCAPKNEFASEVAVKFSLTIFDGTTVSGTYGPLFFDFKEGGLPYRTILKDLLFLNRNSLYLINEMKVLLKFDGAYIKPTNFLLRQMELLKNGSLSDFTVVVGSESIRVHKVLLAAGSPVFAGMFSHEGTKEVKEKRVVIPDFSAEVVKDLLQFLYTGVKPKQSCLTTELLKLANKYLIEELKQHCEQHLSTSLVVFSVAGRFEVACMHNAPELKNSCLKFMADHYFEVTKTNGWKELCKSKDLIFEATCGIAKNMQEQGENAKKKIRLS